MRTLKRAAVSDALASVFIPVAWIAWLSFVAVHYVTVATCGPYTALSAWGLLWLPPLLGLYLGMRARATADASVPATVGLTVNGMIVVSLCAYVLYAVIRSAA